MLLLLIYGTDFVYIGECFLLCKFDYSVVICRVLEVLKDIEKVADKGLSFRMCDMHLLCDFTI